MSEGSIKAIGFDYGGVLKGDPTTHFLKNICELLDITPEQYIKSYYKFNKPVQRGEMTWTELWEKFAQDIGQPRMLPQILSLFAASEHKQLNQHMITLVKHLKHHGYKVGLLSNNTLAAANRMRSEKLEPLFDAFHVSAETGFVKPEPQAFVHLANALGVNVHDMVFVDDSQKSLSTADQVGFIPITFTGYEKLVAQLHELGVQTS